MRFVRSYGRYLAVIAVLAAIAAASGAYILVNQRISVPWQDRYTVKMDVSSSSGLTPGLGQAVNVAGVRVGQISGAKLNDGVAQLSLEIDPKKLPHVYTNATAALVPNTPLKDMIVELGPGGRPAGPLPDGGEIGVAATDPPIDSDELTSALDADTRDFLGVLLSDAGTGLEGRGKDLNRVLRTLRPTARQLQRVSGALASRRRELKRLVGNLALLTKTTAGRDQDLAEVVSAANATLGAIGSQDAALRASLERLPPTLTHIRTSLDTTADFTDELTPTLNRLLPAVRRLPAALRAADPLLRTATPVLRENLRPLVREAVPLARDLDPATRDLRAVTPALTEAFQVLTYVVNETAYNPPGSDEGFLYWLAWFAHNGASFLSTQDAHGPVWRGLLLTSCDSVKEQPGLGPLLDVVLGVTAACDTGA